MSSKRWSILSSLIVIIIAIFGLLSYLPGLSYLGSVKEGYIPMAPSTSVSFIACSAVILFSIKQHTSWLPKFSLYLLIFFVTIFGLLDLIGYFLGKDLNFEETIVPISGTLNGIPIARMSPATSALFVLLGLIVTLHLLNFSNQKASNLNDYIKGWLSILLFSGGLIFSLAYFFGAPLLYNNKVLTIPMALTTAIAFIFSAMSVILSSKESFPLRLISKDTTKSYLFRYVVLLVFLSITISSISTRFSELIHNINPAFIASGSTIIILFAGAFLADIISKHLSIVVENQKEAINQSKKALEKSEEHFRMLYETMVQGVVYQNAKGEITSANPAAERILGLSLNQMLGRSSIDPRWKAVDKDKNDLTGEKHPAMIVLRTSHKIENFIQGIFNPKTNDYVWILTSSIPQFQNGSDKPSGVYSTFLDITEQRNAELKLQELKLDLEQQVNEKTHELNERIAELEHFHEVTVERELRMEELRQEIERLKKSETKA